MIKMLPFISILLILAGYLIKIKALASYFYMVGGLVMYLYLMILLMKYLDNLFKYNDDDRY